MDKKAKQSQRKSEEERGNERHRKKRGKGKKQEVLKDFSDQQDKEAYMKID